MTKFEFEIMAIRKGEPISGWLFDEIEGFHMAESDYHQAHGGVDETKEDFVKRVFGGKVNTPKTIATKMAKEAFRKNRWALRGERIRHQNRIRQNGFADFCEHPDSGNNVLSLTNF